LLALVAMGGFLWLRSHNKLWLGLALLALAPLMFAFMPESWVERMRTIQTYEQDLSAQGRINAWWMAFNAAKDRITGLGFATASNELFAIYAPNPDLYLAAHSIYFQVLGEHGFPGLFLFLMVWFTTWLCANWIRRHSRSVAELQWAFVLASMIQVSMVAYLVGGTFLSLSYFDLPYYELAAVVIVREIIRERERGLYAQQAKEAATRDRAPAAASPGGSGQPAPQ
jgi:probable O-glycosylation ligase (exosortase A-associated)